VGVKRASSIIHAEGVRVVFFREAIAFGISAGLIHGGPERPELLDGTPIFAFDGDAVLFSGEADTVFREKNMEGFEAFEFDNLETALPPGPLQKFALALEELRAGLPIDTPPFRIALVTARAITYSARPLRTLRGWGIRVDQSFFLDGMSKGTLLSALKPLIFFDDSLKNCTDASASTPTVRIPIEEPAKQLVIALSSGAGRSAERFLQVCKLVLKKTFDQDEPELRMWQEGKLTGLTDEALEKFTAELERSAIGTPRGGAATRTPAASGAAATTGESAAGRRSGPLCGTSVPAVWRGNDCYRL
jgi:5'-nucleotidase